MRTVKLENWAYFFKMILLFLLFFIWFNNMTCLILTMRRTKNGTILMPFIVEKIIKQKVK
ncbi:MAG: hypothetical protein A2096_00790 [Spirochaetes bacterium GWF1_41_5]|nr:MAG: hypothetical protein A2096_00790 [Spirochaetes bacterium GWF1_41_5]HBE03542.1 hypothetical protein [Spirochaetia bacterium]